MSFCRVDILYVLRPLGTMYQLIGEVYVANLMLGEAYLDTEPDTTDYNLLVV